MWLGVARSGGDDGRYQFLINSVTVFYVPSFWYVSLVVNREHHQHILCV
jgi:hypothetical protein